MRSDCTSSWSLLIVLLDRLWKLANHKSETEIMSQVTEIENHQPYKCFSHGTSHIVFLPVPYFGYVLYLQQSYNSNLSTSDTRLILLVLCLKTKQNTGTTSKVFNDLNNKLYSSQSLTVPNNSQKSRNWFPATSNFHSMQNISQYKSEFQPY